MVSVSGGVDDELRKSVKEIHSDLKGWQKSNSLVSKRMIWLTVVIAFLTVVMVVMIGVQIWMQPFGQTSLAPGLPQNPDGIFRNDELSLEVEIFDQEDGKVGMGVIFTDGKVVTAKHVVSKKDGWKVRWEGEEFFGKVEWRDDEKDLAVLGVEGILGEVEVGGEGEILRIGESWGGILGVDQNLWDLEKVISGLTKVEIEVKRGESGRGVWNEKGELVGIVIGFDEDWWGMWLNLEVDFLEK